jgi:hypothetical protein
VGEGVRLRLPPDLQSAEKRSRMGTAGMSEGIYSH